MANGTQETHNQYVLQQNFSYGGIPTQCTNAQNTKASHPYMAQENYPCSVHPTQVNTVDPSLMNTHGAQSGAPNHNPYIAQQNQPYSMLPVHINDPGAPDFRTHSMQNGPAQYPNSANPNQRFPRPNALPIEVRTPAAYQTSAGQRGTRYITAADLWPVLKRFKSEKETAERQCGSLQAQCGTLQAEKDFFDKERNSWVASHNAIQSQCQKIHVYCQNLQKEKGALKQENQNMVERINALQAANVQIRSERGRFRRLSAHLSTIIMKAQKELFPPSNTIVQQVVARGQGRALHDRPDPTSQAHCRVQPKDAVSGSPELPHGQAGSARAPLTPPTSVSDAPTSPIVVTKETNPSTPSEVIDLCYDGGRGIKRKSPDSGWDNGLRAPNKRTWEYVGKQQFEEKAQEKEKSIIEKGKAACKEARKKSAKKPKTTKNPEVPAPNKPIAAEPNGEQPEQADAITGNEDLEAFAYELEAMLNEEAAAKEAQSSGEPSETTTSLTPKGQSVSASDPGVEAHAAALEEDLTAVNATVDKQTLMSFYEEEEVPPFDDLFDEMEGSSAQQE